MGHRWPAGPNLLFFGPRARVGALAHLLRRTSLAAMVFTTCSCLLPPHGDAPPQTTNHAPEINLASLDPDEPFSLLSPELEGQVDCVTKVRATQITDFDDRRLLFRWVKNNRLLGMADLLEEQEPSIRTEGEAHSAMFSLHPKGHFRNEVKTADPQILSLFVTDAPEFEPEIPGTTTVDFGTLPAATLSDTRRYSVVEVRWTFVFTASVTDNCPGAR